MCLHISNSEKARYLEVNLNNILKALVDLRGFEPGPKPCKGRMREDCSHFGIEAVACERSDGVVVFAELDWCCEVHASN